MQLLLFLNKHRIFFNLAQDAAKELVTSVQEETERMQLAKKSVEDIVHQYLANYDQEQSDDANRASSIKKEEVETPSTNDGENHTGEHRDA